MAFYDDMAEVATDLLTEFGKTLTFERITKTFNKITGKDTSRTTAEYTTVGVEVPINQRLVDGTRIQAGDRFFIIDSSFAPAMGDRLQDSPFVACSFPMNAIQADIDAVYGPVAETGITALPVSNAGKTATFTPVTALAAGTSRLQFNAPLMNFQHDTTTGKKVFELEFVFDAGGLESTAVGAFISSGFKLMDAFDKGIGATLEQRLGTTSLTIATSPVSGSPITTVIPAVTSPCVIGFCMDSATSALTIIHNGSPVTPTAGGDVYVPSAALLYMLQSDETGGAEALAAADADKTITTTVRLAAADITQTYPVGATDMCENQIGYPQISHSWAIVDIQPIQPASTVVAYRLQVRK